MIIRNGYIGISDLELYQMKSETINSVRYARHRIRDEQNRLTWVCDRLLGLTPDHLISIPSKYIGE